jgi:tetratricopeptide (TPR) repeat protein
LGKQGKLDEAVSLFREALKINPEFKEAYNNLGIALLSQGKLDEAISQFREALKINPEYVNARYNLGTLLANQGKLDEAMSHFREALRLNPKFVEAYNNLGLLLASQGRIEEAIVQYREVLRIDPASPGVQYKLGSLLTHQGEIDEATVHFKEAIRLNPKDPLPYNDLAWIRATYRDARFRDGTEAIKLAKQACELTKDKDPNFLDTLGAAYAEGSRFKEAIATVEEAIALAGSHGQQGLVQGLEKRLREYKAGRPYREDQVSRQNGKH